MPVPQMTPPTTAPKPGQAPSPGQQPPMGQSQATQPTSNRGSEVQAIQQVAAATRFIEQAMAGVGAASELGQKLHKILGDLIKLAPVGSSSPAGEKNAMQNQAMQMAQRNQAATQARQQAMQGQGGAQRPQMPQGQPGMPA